MTKYPRKGFGWALDQLTRGGKVYRAGWNGKGLWLELQAAATITSPFLALRSVTGTLVPWTPSQTDQLAEDWVLYQP
jgi:hypothetical protein